MRLMVYGDSNSWGFPPDGLGVRFDENTRWPCVMATALGATLIEETLPGRTTVHDDPEFYGAAMNGLAHLPVALLSHSPLDLVLIMLGTNDFKARFAPETNNISENIVRLAQCVRDTGAAEWIEPPQAGPGVALVVPSPLSPHVEQADYERRAEWVGGRAASLGLAAAVQRVAGPRNVPVFDAGAVVSGAASDPIHLDADSHIVLGRALAGWVQKMNVVAAKTVS